MAARHLLPFRLSVPHNGDPDLPAHILGSDWTANVAEVYFAGNPLVIPSGRRPKIKHYISGPRESPTFDADRYDRDLGAMIARFTSRSIRSNLLLNAEVHLSAAQIDYVERLLDHGANAVTVGTRELAAQVRALWGERVQIQNSVYISLSGLQDIPPLLDLGVSIFLVPPDWNHDLDLLAAAREIVTSRRAELKLMVNEGCLKRCPHRIDDLRDAQSYPVEMAMRDFLDNPSETRLPPNACRAYLGRTGIAHTNYIHPADIARYAFLDPMLKIVGRSFPSATILGTCRAYVEGHYQGDLRHLVENFKHARAPVLHEPAGKAVFY